MKNLEVILIDDMKYINIVGVAITNNQMLNMNGTDVIEKVEEDNEIIKKPLFIIVKIIMQGRINQRMYFVQ